MSWTGTRPYELESGQVIGVHADAADCFNWTCAIHAGNAHPLASAPRYWEPRAEMIFRICPHGQHHPDRDTYPRSLCFCDCDCCAW